MAYLEMYMILAILFSRFDIELHDTDASSMEWVDHGMATNRSDVKITAQRRTIPMPNA